jgi:cytoskeletal protein RodZ
LYNGSKSNLKGRKKKVIKDERIQLQGKKKSLFSFFFILLFLVFFFFFKVASYNNNTEKNPFEDSSEFGSSHHQTRDLLDSHRQPFSSSTSSSTLQDLPAPIQQQAHLKRQDSSFAMEEGRTYLDMK